MTQLNLESGSLPLLGTRLGPNSPVENPPILIRFGKLFAIQYQDLFFNHLNWSNTKMNINQRKHKTLQVLHKVVKVLQPFGIFTICDFAHAAKL